MAESTLRENRRGATHQNATIVNQARMRVLVQEPFYQHDHLGPGAPLREITGQGDGDGYYDWAGRRLFTIDGEPDPMCPGAYRYQHNPDCCDLEAPDSDPRSPRYEPMHLRHKPGDTWITDTNRPYDPFDSGPFGSPGWYKDERTGRHRRDETPDPLPAEGWVPPKGAWFPGTADWPEPVAPQPKAPKPDERTDRRGGSEGPPPWGSRGRPVPSEPEASGSGEQPDRRGGSDRPPPPWGSRGRPVPSEPDEPEEPQRPWGARTGRPSPSLTPDTELRPARRPWDRGEPGSSGPGDAGWISGYGGSSGEGSSGGRESNSRSRADTTGEHERASRSAADTTGEFRFSKLREDAFDRFIANSAHLRAAHFAPQKPYLRERAVWVLRWLLWVFALGLAPMPAPLQPNLRRPESAAVQPIPAQPGPESRVRVSESRVGRAEAVQSEGDRHGDRWSQAERPQRVEPDPSCGPGVEPTPRPGGARSDLQDGWSQAERPQRVEPEPSSRPGVEPTPRPGGARSDLQDGWSQARRPQPAEAEPSRRPGVEPADLPDAESTYRPGAAIAAAVAGARAARKAIADRTTRTSSDLAAAVRDSANRTSPAQADTGTNRADSANRTGPARAGADRASSAFRSGDGHWRTRPRQDRPRPAPRPALDLMFRSSSRPAPGAYMTAWEHAFDTSATFILNPGVGSGIGATA